MSEKQDVYSRITDRIVADVDLHPNLTRDLH